MIYDDDIYQSVQRGPGSRTYNFTKLRQLLDLPACDCSMGIRCPELLLNPTPEALKVALKKSRFKKRPTRKRS